MIKNQKNTDKKLSTPKKRAPQKRGIDTRGRLLKVAAKCLVDEGIHSLRFSHIAQKAKIPQALIGYHFPTTEDLLMAVFLVEVEKLKVHSVTSVEKHLTQPKKALVAYIRSPFDLAEKDRQFRVCWTAFYHLCTISAEFTELNDQIRKTGRERILNLLSMLLATEGRFSSGLIMSREDLMALAVRIQAIMTGFVIMAATESVLDFKKLADQAVLISLELLDLA